MEKLIEAFTENISEGLRIAAASHFKTPEHAIQNIVICGMGGSGIGGKLVSQWTADFISVPIILCQDYSLPCFVNQHTLVIASSYSGNTEETTSAMKIAQAKKAHIVAISSGGFVEDFCKEFAYDHVKVPGGNQPRAAIAYSFVQLLNIFSGLGLMSDFWKDEIARGRDLIDANLQDSKKLGKTLAEFIYGKFPVIYTEAAYESIAVRARQQLNENSKCLGWSLAIPEMNHNELVGWGGGNDHLAVIFIKTEDMNPRNRRRMELTQEIVSAKTKSVYELHAKGNSQIERSLYLINVLDWASFYLVDLNQVDVFDIKVINHLKNELSKM